MIRTSEADAPPSCSTAVAALDTVSATDPLHIDGPGAAGPSCLGVEQPSLSEHSVRCRFDHPEIGLLLGASNTQENPPLRETTPLDPLRSCLVSSPTNVCVRQCLFSTYVAV